MTSVRRPSHLLAASLAIGLALANVVRADKVGLAVSLFAGLAAVAAGSPQGRLALMAILLCGAGWSWASLRLERLDRSPLLAEVGRGGRATVVITSQPVDERFDVRAEGQVRVFEGRKVDEPAQLELPAGRSPPQGAILDALVVVKLPPGPENGFDERTWLRRHGIHVVLKVDRWTQVGERGGLGGVSDRLRDWLGRSLAPRLTGERRAVLEGIVLGDGNALSPGLRQDFQASGLFHILAVSGQNVVLVAGGALILAWLLGVSRWIGEVGALVGIACYVLAVGPQPSVIRAGIAGALASLAWLTGRLRDAWYALLVGAIALLGWNPYLVYDPGFQLSFAAVVAIFTVVPAIARRLESTLLPRSVRLGVAVSTGCGLVTAPILWIQFGYLPLLSVPANALAEPAMPILLGLAFVTAGLDSVAPGCAAVVAWLNGWVAAYIAFCARSIGSLPFAEVTSLRGLAALLGVLVLTTYACYRWRTSSRLRI